MKATQRYVWIFAALTAVGAGWFFWARRGLVTKGVVTLTKGKRYRQKYEHTKEAGEAIRTLTEAAKLVDPTIVIEMPSDTVTIVESVSPQTTTMKVPNTDMPGVTVVSVQELSGLSGTLGPAYTR